MLRGGGVVLEKLLKLKFAFISFQDRARCCRDNSTDNRAGKRRSLNMRGREKSTEAVGLGESGILPKENTLGQSIKRIVHTTDLLHTIQRYGSQILSRGEVRTDLHYHGQLYRAL